MSWREGWVVQLPFTVTVGGGAADELGLGTLWGPGVIEHVRFSKTSVDLMLRAFIVPGRVPLREGAGGEDFMGAERVFGTEVDPGEPLGRRGLDYQTATEENFPLGRVVPWECWSIMLHVENLSAGALRCAGLFIVRVMDHPLLPVPAFWERERAPHLARVSAGLGIPRDDGRPS